MTVIMQHSPCNCCTSESVWRVYVAIFSYGLLVFHRRR